MSVTATFTAPMQLAETATLVFRSDGDGRAQCEFVGRGVGRGVAGAERRAGGERGAGADSGRGRGSGTLRGVAFDPENEMLRYQWSQTSGQPTVVLSGATSSVATFTSPSGLAEAAVLGFALRADGRARSGDDRAGGGSGGVGDEHAAGGGCRFRSSGGRRGGGHAARQCDGHRGRRIVVQMGTDRWWRRGFGESDGRRWRRSRRRCSWRRRRRWCSV